MLATTVRSHFERVHVGAGEKAGSDESAVEEPPTTESLQPASVFWNELLQSGYQDLQQVQMAALGKGKRERRQVSPPHLVHA